MKYPNTYGEINNVALQALGTATTNSLAYKIAHLLGQAESAIQTYGLTSNTIARKAVTPIVVTGGSDAWGTELELHNGATIESGDTVKKFDLEEMQVTAVGTANRVTALEFYSGTVGTLVTSIAITDATDTFTKAGHGFTNGQQIMLSSIVTTTGINAYTAYYVVGVAGDDFQVSLTDGGAAVVVGGGDGTCSAGLITKTLLAECVNSEAATTSDSHQYHLHSGSVTCNNRVWCRGWSAGGTNAISFFLGVHTFTA